MAIFDEMIFGSGAWITFLVLTALSLVIIKLYRYAGVITAFLWVLLGLKYFQLYSSGDTNMTWFFVFTWIDAVFQVFVMLKVK